MSSKQDWMLFRYHELVKHKLFALQKTNWFTFDTLFYMGCQVGIHGQFPKILAALCSSSIQKYAKKFHICRTKPISAACFWTYPTSKCKRQISQPDLTPVVLSVFRSKSEGVEFVPCSLHSFSEKKKSLFFFFIFKTVLFVLLTLFILFIKYNSCLKSKIPIQWPLYFKLGISPNTHLG